MDGNGLYHLFPSELGIIMGLPYQITTVDGCEILHQLGLLKPYFKKSDKPSISWCRISQPSTVVHIPIKIILATSFTLSFKIGAGR